MCVCAYVCVCKDSPFAIVEVTVSDLPKKKKKTAIKAKNSLLHTRTCLSRASWWWLWGRLFIIMQQVVSSLIKLFWVFFLFWRGCGKTPQFPLLTDSLCCWRDHPPAIYIIDFWWRKIPDQLIFLKKKGKKRKQIVPRTALAMGKQRKREEAEEEWDVGFPWHLWTYHQLVRGRARNEHFVQELLCTVRTDEEPAWRQQHRERSFSVSEQNSWFSCFDIVLFALKTPSSHCMGPITQFVSMWPT